MSRRSCVWSGKSDERLVEVRVVVRDRLGGNPAERMFRVLPEHEAEFRAFCERSLRYGLRYLVILVVSVVVLLAAIAMAVSGWGRLGLLLAGASMVFQGFLIWRYPFSTPETVEMLGVANSIRVVRGLAVINVLLGLLVMTLDWILPRL